jgi:hypothetical protein
MSTFNWKIVSLELVSLKGWSHEIKWSFDDYTAYLRTFLPSAAGFYIKNF